MTVHILHLRGDLVVGRKIVTSLLRIEDRLHSKEIPNDMVVVRMDIVSTPHIPLYWLNRLDDPPITVLTAGICMIWRKDKLQLL